jgi:hypothetical protein
VYQEVSDQADDGDDDNIVSEGVGLNELASLTLELMVEPDLLNSKHQKSTRFPENNKGLNNLMHVSPKRTLMRTIFDT